jgi:hypothetical protein
MPSSLVTAGLLRQSRTALEAEVRERPARATPQRLTRRVRALALRTRATG